MAGHLQSIAFISMPGTGEWMVILFIGLLIFGRRLPEVARSLGKSVNEFKKGLRDFQDSADEVVSDVNKIQSDVVNDVASEVKEASGMDSTGYDDSHGLRLSVRQGETVGDAGTTESETAHRDRTSNRRRPERPELQRREHRAHEIARAISAHFILRMRTSVSFESFSRVTSSFGSVSP